MSVSEFSSGYWTYCDNHFCNNYNTEAEARDHIRFQKEEMHSKGRWGILYIPPRTVQWIKVEE